MAGSIPEYGETTAWNRQRVAKRYATGPVVASGTHGPDATTHRASTVVVSRSRLCRAGAAGTRFITIGDIEIGVEKPESGRQREDAREILIRHAQ